jgi:hypothetical protein
LDGTTELPPVSNPETVGDDHPPVATNGSATSTSPARGNLLQMEHMEIVQQNGNIGGYISRLAGPNDNTAIVHAKTSGRSKACKDCRKSKVSWLDQLRIDY